MNAGTLLNLLLAKHSKDVCVPECKDGPTHATGSHFRMDLWTMPRSWSRPWISAYEIKVARNDFMRDDKWPSYLPLCNMLSFVCPWGLISPEELPESVGLYWASKNLSRLYCKRKPPLRQGHEIPESVWRYVLMCRARIGDESSADFNRDAIAAYLEDREENWRVDQMFKSAVRKAVDSQVSEVIEKNKGLEDENARLLRQQEACGAVAKALEEVGVDIDQTRYQSVADQLRRHFGVEKWDLQKVRSAQQALNKMLEHIDSRGVE